MSQYNRLSFLKSFLKLAIKTSQKRRQDQTNETTEWSGNLQAVLFKVVCAKCEVLEDLGYCTSRGVAINHFSKSAKFSKMLHLIQEINKNVSNKACNTLK